MIVKLAIFRTGRNYFTESRQFITVENKSSSTNRKQRLTKVENTSSCSRTRSLLLRASENSTGWRAYNVMDTLLFSSFSFALPIILYRDKVCSCREGENWSSKLLFLAEPLVKEFSGRVSQAEISLHSKETWTSIMQAQGKFLWKDVLESKGLD